MASIDDTLRCIVGNVSTRVKLSAGLQCAWNTIGVIMGSLKTNDQKSTEQNQRCDYFYSTNSPFQTTITRNAT